MALHYCATVTRMPRTGGRPVRRGDPPRRNAGVSSLRPRDGVSARARPYGTIPAVSSVMETRTSSIMTGVPGLDHVLAGGLPSEHVYLVQGDPGAGKTTLALQYLLEGRRAGERGLYIALGETKAELAEIAASHGWSLEGIDVFELNDGQAGAASNYTMFHPSEVELGETTKRVTEVVDAVKPSRLVFDSLSEMRLLARDALRYRRQILAFKQFFTGKGCTVLLLDDGTSEAGDLQLQSIAHGVVTMEHLSPEYGGERRRLRVVKLRGVAFRGGYHDFTIERGGVVVYPRLVASEHRERAKRDRVSSGVTGLDDLCGGGLDRGSSTLILGPAGAGKSTVALQFVLAAARRGERSTIFAFDEGSATLCARAAGLGMPLEEHMETGAVRVIQVDPAELAPSQFSNFVQREVAAGSKVVVIDSLNGYLNAMPEERFLIIQMHELLSYLSQQGVVTIMTLAQHGLLGDRMATPVDLSYLADSALLLRYFEAGGKVHKAISMIKKRHGPHEKTIREFCMGADGVRVGRPLEAFRGVLTGVPIYDGAHNPLMLDDDDGAAT
jgi:circadian clock protein KaiC